jgi:hypothetical protein
LFVIGVLASFLVTSWITLFGRVENPLFVQRLYAQVPQGDTDMRNVDLAILERMRTDWRADESVGVLPEKSSIVRLLDIGIPSTEIDLRVMDKSLWPQWIMGRRNVMESEPYVKVHRGAYELVVGDTIGRYGLYRRVK